MRFTCGDKIKMLGYKEIRSLKKDQARQYRNMLLNVSYPDDKISERLIEIELYFNN